MRSFTLVLLCPSYRDARRSNAKPHAVTEQQTNRHIFTIVKATIWKFTTGNRN